MMEIRLSGEDAKQAILIEVFRQTGARLKSEDVNIAFVGPCGKKEINAVYIVKKDKKDEFERKLENESSKTIQSTRAIR